MEYQVQISSSLIRINLDYHKCISMLSEFKIIRVFISDDDVSVW